MVVDLDAPAWGLYIGTCYWFEEVGMLLCGYELEEVWQECQCEGPHPRRLVLLQTIQNGNRAYLQRCVHCMEAMYNECNVYSEMQTNNDEV